MAPLTSTPSAGSSSELVPLASCCPWCSGRHGRAPDVSRAVPRTSGRPATPARRPSTRSKREQLVEEVNQPVAARWVTQLAQRLGLNLTNAFASDTESPADLLQR